MIYSSDDSITTKKVDIIRYVNDLYQFNYDVKLGNDYIDLTDYKVYFYYKEFDKIIRIEAIYSDAKQGKVVFYPRRRYCEDVTDEDNIVSYYPIKKIGEFDYAIVRTKFIYDRYDDGDWVWCDDEWQKYDEDNDDHDGLQRYDKDRWNMTHQVGKLIVLDRVGL